MKAKALVKIILTPNSTEQAILITLKNAIGDEKLNPLLSWNEITLIEVVVQKGYHAILKYLIEEKAISPSRAPGAGHTKNLIHISIENKNPQIAIYLFNLFNHLVDTNQSADILLHAIEQQNLPVIQAILNKKPYLIYYKTFELLFKALILPTDDIAIFLLENGASTMALFRRPESLSAFEMAIARGKSAIIAKMFELSEMQFTDPKHFFDNVSSNNEITPLQKRLCTSALLKGGFGLNTADIPDQSLALYGLKRSFLGSFLIMGEEKQPDGSWKDKFIYNTDVLRKALSDSHWRFNFPALLQAVSSLQCRQIPNIKVLEDLLRPHAIESTAPNKIIRNPAYLDLYQTWDTYCNHKTNLQRLVNKASKEILPFNDLQLSLKNFFTTYHELIHFLSDPTCDQITLKKNNTLTLLLDKDIKGLLGLAKSFEFHTDYDIANQCFFITGFISNKLKSITSKHKETLSKHNFLRMTLFEVRADSSFHLAKLYFACNEEHQLTLSLHYSIDSIRFFEKVVELMEKTGKKTDEYRKVKHTVFNVLMLSYLKMGNISEATSALAERKKTLVIPTTSIITNFIDLACTLIEADKRYENNAEEVSNFLKKLILETKIQLSSLFLLNKHQAIADIKKSLSCLETCCKRYQVLASQQPQTQNSDNSTEEASSSTQNDTNQFPQTKELLEKLHKLTLEEPKKEKVKTRSQQTGLPIAQEAKAPVFKNYGFASIKDHSPAIPITSHYIPKKSLFISLPENAPAFLPFLNLIYDEKTKSYHEIRSIAEKGLGQQGVKLGTRWQKQEGTNLPPIKVDIARMKVLGTDGKGKLRATGKVQQTIQTQAGKIRKLYVIDEVIEKKTEQRRGL